MVKHNRRVLLTVMAVALAVILLDQASKLIVIHYLDLEDSVSVIPGLFNLTLHFNPGAAFGLGTGLPEGARKILLALTTALALLCLVYFLFRDYMADRIGQIALAMVLGGAFGNIIDRIRFGQVVDFLDFYYSEYHWPAFNLADSAICLGVLILLLKMPIRGASKSAQA